MKPGPLIAMVVMIALGVWMILQPTLRREASDLTLYVGASEVQLKRIDDAGDPRYRVTAPPDLRGDEIRAAELDAYIETRIASWNERPVLERWLLGFFNITRWPMFGFVAVGLLGQGAFFGRMIIQWVISERSRVSTVPEIFWWLSFIGGACFFVYFVWRKDIVGMIGQATGVVVYARNLRLIHKQRRLIGADPAPA